jgi:hypothetical protein
VIFGLSAEEALEKFIELSADVLEKRGIDAQARTAALKTYIERLFEEYVIDKERRLLDSGDRLNGCKL